MSSVAASALFILALVALIVVYIAPILLAKSRRSGRLGAVVAIDVLAGWTVIGWGVALSLALPREDDEPKARHFLMGFGILVALGVGYEIANYFWLHIPAP